MKILLLNLPRYYDKKPVVREECCLGPTGAVPLPNTLLHIGSVIKKYARVRLFDAALDPNTTFKDIEQIIAREKPDAVICTTVPQLFDYEKQIVPLCDKHNAKCIAVPFPLGYAESFVKKAGFFFAVSSEPEKTLLDWVRGTPREKLRGIAYKKGAKVIKNQAQEPWFHKNPPLDWSLLEKNLPKYGWHLYQISRNCPYRCSFCVWAGKPFTQKRVDVIVQDLKYLKSHGVKKIAFLTSEITVNKAWLHEFLEKIKPLHMHFETDIRANEIDRETLIKIRDSGCIGAYIGAESFSQRVLNKIPKGVTVEQNKKAVLTCNELGLPNRIPLMFNIGETDEDVEETIKNVLEVKPTSVSYLLAKCYEGTALEKTRKIYVKEWGSTPVAQPPGLEQAKKRIAYAKSRLEAPLKRHRLLWYATNRHARKIGLKKLFENHFQ